MKKITLLTLCIIYVINPLFSNQNDIDYQKDTILSIVDRIGGGIGGTLASPGLIVTLPLAIFIESQSHVVNAALADFAFLPIYLGAAGGRKLMRPLAITLLAKHYNLSKKAVILSIQYGLTLKIYKDLLYAAETQNKEKVAQFIHQEMYLFFGAHWQKGFEQMLNDFENLLNFKGPRNISTVPFYMNYNKAQIQFFGLMLRVLLTVYQLYYQKDLPTLKQYELRFDDYLIFKQNWINPIKEILNLVTSQTNIE